MTVGSFKTSASINLIPPQWWPSPPSLINYQHLFLLYPTARWALNSFIVAGCATVLSIFFGSMAGYAFAKFRFPFARTLFIVLIMAMLMPRVLVLVPLYILVVHLGWLNTYYGLVLPVVAIPYATFLFRQFLRTVPNEITGAARVDGASEWSIYWRIILPLSKPAIGVIGVLTFVTAWSDYTWQLIAVTNEDMETLPVAITTAITARTTDYGLGMAAATVAAIPMFLIFLGFQRHFVKGLTLGAIK